MNKRQKLYARMELLLEEADAAIEQSDSELATTKQLEFDKVKTEYDLLVKSEEKRRELEAAEKQITESSRLAFNTDAVDSGDDEIKEESYNEVAVKAINNLKLTDKDKQVRSVLNAVYGKDYEQVRSTNRAAFNLWVRYGKDRLNSAGMNSLQQIVMLPKSIEEQVINGMSLAEINANKATLQESSLELGGVLAPEDFREEMVKQQMGIARMRGLARVVQTAREVVEWPVLLGGNGRYTSAVRVTWVDEVPASASVAETNPTFGLKRVQAYTAMARTDISKNNLEDSVFDIMGLLSELFGEAYAIDEDDRLATGAGGNSMFGILKNRSGAEATPATGISETALGSAATLTKADNIIDMQYALPAQYRPNAVWLANATTHAALRKLKTGTGEYLWERSLQAGSPAMLLGYPIIETEAMPSIAANSYPLVYGDLRGMVIVDRVGMTIQRVEDVSTVGTNTVAFFARTRKGSDVVEPWRFQAGKIATS